LKDILQRDDSFWGTLGSLCSLVFIFAIASPETLYNGLVEIRGKEACSQRPRESSAFDRNGGAGKEYVSMTHPLPVAPSVSADSRRGLGLEVEKLGGAAGVCSGKELLRGDSAMLGAF
jgi:hypothetical protein